MPVKRRSSKHRPHLTPELRPKAERLAQLNAEHLAAIRGEPGAEAFYTDGRHEEIGALAAEVHAALGIRPWDDADAIIRAALAGEDGDDD